MRRARRLIGWESGREGRGRRTAIRRRKRGGICRGGGGGVREEEQEEIVDGRSSRAEVLDGKVLDYFLGGVR